MSVTDKKDILYETSGCHLTLRMVNSTYKEFSVNTSSGSVEYE